MSQEVLGILGQIRPAPATETVAYSVPKGKRAAISALFIFNNSGGNVIIDLSIVKGGSNDIPTNPTPIEATILNQVTLATKQGSTDANNIDGRGITLNEFDDIRLVTNTLGVVCHVYGVEVIPEKN